MSTGSPFLSPQSVSRKLLCAAVLIAEQRLYDPLIETIEDAFRQERGAGSMPRNTEFRWTPATRDAPNSGRYFALDQSGRSSRAFRYSFEIQFLALSSNCSGSRRRSLPDTTQELLSECGVSRRLGRPFLHRTPTWRRRLLKRLGI